MATGNHRNCLPQIIVGLSSLLLVASSVSGNAQQAAQRRPAPVAKAAPAAPAPAVDPVTTGALQSPPKTSAQPVEQAASVNGPAFEVNGFRSAAFGMNEADVKAAIVRDFKVKPEAIRAEDNKLERTRIVMVQAPDVLPGGGNAEISYVFGFESKKLIQVGVTWSKAIDDKMSPEQLFNNSNILRSHFITQAYKPDTVATNITVNGGLMMFRGSDTAGHTTLLMLQGGISQSEPNSNQRVLTPTALSLFYVADAKKPDVYRLQPGLF